MTGILISVNGEKMDNVVSNMMAATCEGTIMDNIPIIMTLGTPTAPTWDARSRWTEMLLRHIRHSPVPILSILHIKATTIL